MDGSSWITTFKLGLSKSLRRQNNRRFAYVAHVHEWLCVLADSGQAEHPFRRSLNILLVLTTVGGLLLRLCPNGALLADHSPCGLYGAGVSLRQADVYPKQTSTIDSQIHFL